MNPSKEFHSLIEHDLSLAVEQVRLEYRKALNKWLSECVKKFVPMAYQLVESGQHIAAIRAMDKEGYSYSEQPDGNRIIFTFLLGDIPLSKAVIEVNFTKKADL